jgi:elongation factor Ts
MAISAKQIKELRDATSAGMLACREALEHSDGDFEKAVDYLREKGLAKAAKRADRDASDGMVEVYSHGDGRVGVMVEVNCETDFVSNTEDFRNFVHEVALQIAAAAPLFVKADDVPEEYLEREREVARNRAKEEGKPDKILDKIIEGRIEKYLDEVVLLRQAYIRDESLSIQDLLNEKIVSIGENIVIRRFKRYELGEMTGDQAAEE